MRKGTPVSIMKFLQRQSLNRGRGIRVGVAIDGACIMISKQILYSAKSMNRKNKMRIVCLAIGFVASPSENKRNAGRPAKRTHGRQSRPRREEHKATHVSERLIFVANTRAFRCSNVSPAKRGSSLTSTLYREMSIVNIAISSVSAKLRRVKYPVSKLSNKYTLHTVVPRKHEHLRIWEATKENSCSDAAVVEHQTQLTVTKRHERISIPVLQEPLRNKILGVIPITSCAESTTVISHVVR